MDPKSKRRPGQGASPEASVAERRIDPGSIAGGRFQGEAHLQAHVRLLFDREGRVVELRALDLDRARVVSGYFDQPEALVKEARRLDVRAKGVYVPLNPVQPLRLGRRKLWSLQDLVDWVAAGCP